MSFDICNSVNRYEPCPKCRAVSGMGLVPRGDMLAVECVACGHRGPDVSQPTLAKMIESPEAVSEADRHAFMAWNTASVEAIALPRQAACAMGHKVFGRKVGSHEPMNLLFEGSGASAGGRKVEQSVLDEFSLANTHRQVQMLRDNSVEGYVVFENDPMRYEFTPQVDFVYPAAFH